MAKSDRRPKPWGARLLAGTVVVNSNAWAAGEREFSLLVEGNSLSVRLFVGATGPGSCEGVQSQIPSGDVKPPRDGTWKNQRCHCVFSTALISGPDGNTGPRPEPEFRTCD